MQGVLNSLPAVVTDAHPGLGASWPSCRARASEGHPLSSRTRTAAALAAPAQVTACCARWRRALPQRAPGTLYPTRIRLHDLREGNVVKLTAQWRADLDALDMRW
jgi:hypothetical protein